MASFKNILSVCALLALVQAAPVADVTLTNTVTRTHYTTLNCVKTIWLPSGQSPLPTASSSSKGPSTTLMKSVLYRPTSTTYVAPLMYTSIYVAPTTTSLVPEPVPTTSAYTPPVVETTEQPVYTPPPTTESPVPTTEAPVPTTEAPAPTTQAASSSAGGSGSGGTVSASASNTCESMQDACEGDVTHYDGGLGACGWNVDTTSEMAVALPVGLMGSQSNGNPYCGRTITIKNPNSGTTVQAKVVDKCMGCEGRAIDLTDALFTAVTDGTGDGRESGYEWWFD